MADYTLKQNATGPYIEVTLEDAQGPADLEGTTVTMNMEHEAGSKMLGIEMDFDTDGSDGKIKHQWEKAEGETPAELSVSGEWAAEFKVVAAGGRRTTFPSSGTNSISVEEEIA